MEHFVEVGKRREGETAGLRSPGQRLPECSDAGKRSKGVKRVKRGYATAVQKMASVALDGGDEKRSRVPVSRCTAPGVNEISCVSPVRRTTGNIPNEK